MNNILSFYFKENTNELYFKFLKQWNQEDFFLPKSQKVSKFLKNWKFVGDVRFE